MAEEGTPPLAVLDDKKWKVENVEGTMDEPKVRVVVVAAAGGARWRAPGGRRRGFVAHAS
jgi:hypothetical protein